MVLVGLRMNPLLMGLMQAFLAGGLAVLPVLILEYSLLDEIQDRFTRTEQNEGYDFIVVGAGTTGSVIANRLSENYRVLLLEAGGEPNPLMAIPGAAGIFANIPSLDWRFLTVPQKQSCLSLQNQESLWPRGKSLGGTSNLNFMAYIRGHPFDYDNWAYLTGDDRWNYNNLLPYFTRSENYNGPDDSSYHGHGGPVNIEPDTFAPLSRYFMEAAYEMGYSRVDLNAPYQEGFSEFSFTKKKGRRWGAYQAYLRPIRNSRRTITIRKYSLVTRVLIKGSNNLAYGVEYEHHGTLYTALAYKEVILSAGTVNSPKLLMQSGIGPEKHLMSVGISPLVNLPGVGQNLQDHIIGFTGPFTIDQPLTFLLDRDSSPSHLLNFFQHGGGPLSASGVVASGLIASNYSQQRSSLPSESPTESVRSEGGQGEEQQPKPDDENLWPDIQLILFAIPIHKQGVPLFASLFNLRQQIAEDFYGPVAGKDSFHIMSIIARPKSRGQILLASANPKQPPLIDPNYLSHEDDIKIIAEGMKKAIHMVENTASFQSIGARLSRTPFPTCAHLEYRSDEYWECYIRQYTLSVYHPAGTCSMGKIGEPSAVVDSTLKVIGTERLRVIDASVMPQIISSNIQAACLAIGERGAQFIKDDWEHGG